MADGFSQLRGLIFDFDGTLIDSYAAHLENWAATMQHFGVEFDEPTFLACYSPNWYLVYEALGLPRERWKEADAHWLKLAENNAPEAFPGVREAVGELSQRFEMAIVTAGTRSRVERDLRRIGLSSLITTLVANEDAPRPKPAPDGLHMALDRLGLSPEEGLYVGDSRADLEMAQGLSMAFVGIDGPFRAFDDGHLVLSSVAELPGLLGR